MPDNLGLLVNRKALNETILWSRGQSFSSDSLETPELLYRRELIRKAGKLLQRTGHRQDALNSPDWHRAISMLKEADPDSLAPLQSQLRSPPLEPRSALGDNITNEKRQEIVDEVVSRRSSLLASYGATERKEIARRRDGRLLIYYPDENVSDGASRYASKGFFDPYDAPPWDLWVSYDGIKLVSWVPAALIPLAQEGIDANAVECIRWADSAFIP